MPCHPAVLVTAHKRFCSGSGPIQPLDSGKLPLPVPGAGDEDVRLLMPLLRQRRRSKGEHIGNISHYIF